MPKKRKPKTFQKAMLLPHAEKQMGMKELFKTVDSLLQSVWCLVMYGVW